MTSRIGLVVCIIILCAVFAGCAQDGSPDPTGDWAGWGYLDEGGDLPLRMGFGFEQGAAIGRLDSPAQRAFDLPIQTVIWSPPRLKLERVTSEGRLLRFDAELRDDTLSGRFDLGGSQGSFEMHRSPEPLPHVEPEAYADCVGTYRVAGGRHLVIGSRSWGELLYTELESGRHGTLFPTSESTFFAGAAMYVPGPVSARAEFVRDENGAVSHVEWQEAGGPVERGTRLGFIEEEVAFLSGETTLRGSLIRPDREGPFPALAVLGGANWDTRGSIRRDAEIFASFGMAVLIYDKRGYGESTGAATAPFATTAADAIAAVGYLVGRDDVIADQVGLTGRSRGGWFAPLAASRSNQVAFLVLFVSPAVSPAEQETTSRLNLMRERGHSDEEVGLARELLDLTWEYARTGHRFDEYEAARTAAVDAGFPDALFEAETVDSPDWEWVRLNMHYDPLPALERVTCPVLALFGGADRTVVAADNLPRMRGALQRAGNPDFTLIEIPNAGHGLRPVVGDDEKRPLHRRTGFGPAGWPDVRRWLEQRVNLESVQGC